MSVRYFCESCGKTASALRGEPDESASRPGECEWASGRCACGGTLHDLSYPHARDTLDERIGAASQKQDVLGAAVVAPFAVVGFVVGCGLAYGLYVVFATVIGRLPVALVAVPLLTTIGFSMLPLWVLGKRRSKTPQWRELSFTELEALESIERERGRAGGVHSSAGNPNSVF